MMTGSMAIRMFYGTCIAAVEYMISGRCLRKCLLLWKLCRILEFNMNENEMLFFTDY